MIYFGNVFDVAMILVKILTGCNIFGEYSCSTGKLFRTNVFFINTFLLSKFLYLQEINDFFIDALTSYQL